MNFKPKKRNQSRSKNCSKVNNNHKCTEDKENFKILSSDRINHEHEHPTTKVRKHKLLKRIVNESTPDVKKNLSKNCNDLTEKYINVIRHRVDSEKKFEEDVISTTFSDYDKSDKSTSHMILNKEEKKSNSIQEKRLEDIFIKNPRSGNTFDKIYNAIDHWYIYEEFLHPLIPSLSDNNEIYKNNLIHRHFKKSSTANFKTDSCKTIEYFLHGKGKRNFLEFDSLNDKKGFSNKLENQINFTKKRKVSSCKKVYESVLTFHDSDNNPHFFKVYNDNDTGFDDRYNQILKIMEMDNDVETDDEQLYLAKNFTFDNLADTIKNFNTKQLKNKLMFKRSKTVNPRRRRR
jgi:hypothetical protein